MKVGQGDYSYTVRVHTTLRHYICEYLHHRLCLNLHNSSLPSYLYLFINARTAKGIISIFFLWLYLPLNCNTTIYQINCIVVDDYRKNTFIMEVCHGVQTRPLAGFGILTRTPNFRFVRG